MPARSDLLKAAINAGAVIDAVYQYVDRIKVCGGPTTISGIAACKAMVDSLEQNRHRVEPTILKPLWDAIAAEEKS